MKNKVTMQDIADHLQISKNSVSQALTGKDGVSEATRALVKETAERLGYVYRKSRRGLSKTKLPLPLLPSILLRSFKTAAPSPSLLRIMLSPENRFLETFI